METGAYHTQIHTPTVVQGWPSSWILTRIRNQVKTASNGIFLCLSCKITHKLAFCIILYTIFTFIAERSLENM